MDSFPRTTVGGIGLPRLLIGTNWFPGYSHTSRAKSQFIRDFQDAERIAEVVEVQFGPHLNEAGEQGADIVCLGEMIDSAAWDVVSRARAIDNSVFLVARSRASADSRRWHPTSSSLPTPIQSAWLQRSNSTRC